MDMNNKQVPYVPAWRIGYLGCEVLRPACFGYLNDPPGTELFLSVNVHDRCRLQNMSSKVYATVEDGTSGHQGFMCLLSAYATAAYTLQHKYVYQMDLSAFLALHERDNDCPGPWCHCMCTSDTVVGERVYVPACQVDAG